MIHSPSRPAKELGSTPSTSSIQSATATEDVPFEVNVSRDVGSSPTSHEQLINSEQVQDLAAPFVHRWNRLISQTNWEKGRIIFEWRANLINSGVGPNAYSDEAWARSVEGVSPQHVGRLRRVHERFSDSHPSFVGLFWTHFLAALDWSDAELWLEGAVQSRWSVSEMRRTRWEAKGQDPTQRPNESDIVAAERDDDFSPLVESEDSTEFDREPQDRVGTTGPLAEGSDFGEGESVGLDDSSTNMEYEGIDSEQEVSPMDRVSPFAALPELPSDIAEAMEQFKIAIVRHRSSNWQDISSATIQQVLDALATFARSSG